MAEAIANHLYGAQLEARSAGSQPKSAPNPLAIETLKRQGVPTDGLRSKCWDDVRGRGFDLVVTLCETAARETCPTFPGSPGTTHWPFPDPPTAEDPGAMFERVYAGLAQAIERFANSSGEIDQRAAEVAGFVRQRFGHIKTV